MRGIRSLTTGGVFILLLAGCANNGSSSNDNSGGNDNAPSFEQTVELDLGTNGEFALLPGAPAERRFSASVADALGIGTLDVLELGIEPQSVTLELAGTNGAGTNGLLSLEVRLGPLDDEDVCTSGLPLGRFELGVGTNGVAAVEPARLAASASGRQLVESGDGQFELCLRAESPTERRLDIEQLVFFLNTTAPELSCAEVFALAQVQDALDLLADEGFRFELRRGSTPRNITGTYQVTHRLEFTQNGERDEALPQRSDVFRGQTGGRITRATGRIEIEPFITGNDTGVSLCVVGRTHNADCDQTIARVESYDVGSNGVELDGEFLAVVLERHSSRDQDCGQTGDFIFGSINLRRTDVPDVTVPDDEAPDDDVPPDEPPDPLDDVPPDPLDDAPPDPLDDGNPDPLAMRAGRRPMPRTRTEGNCGSEIHAPRPAYFPAE